MAEAVAKMGGKVRSIRDKNLARRLYELGVLPGKTIQLVRQSPMGKCVYVKAGTTLMALRKEEWEQIEIIPA